MTRTLIAASLIAAFSGFVATGAAHADASNGAAQRSTQSVYWGATVAQPGAVAASASNVVATASPAADADLYFSKSHGRP